MKKTGWIILIAWVFPVFLWAQHDSNPQDIANILKQKVWTDGAEFVKYISSDEPEVMGVPNPSLGDATLLFFIGGSLHEGGTHFCLEKQGDDFVITDRNTDSYQWFPIGSKVDYSSGTGYVIVREPQHGRVCGALCPLQSSRQLADLIRKDLRVFGLAGIYVDEAGNRYQFSADENKVSDASYTTCHYIFEEEFDTPSMILKFPDKYLKALPTHDGLRLRPVAKNEEDYFMPVEGTGDFILQRIFAPDEYEFPLTSDKVLTGAEINLYAGYYSIPYQYGSIDFKKSVLDVIDALQMMRNEIYARHHYAFKNPKWQQRFGGKTWYQAEQEDVTEKLTEIERINVSHIRYWEEQMKKKLEETY